MKEIRHKDDAIELTMTMKMDIGPGGKQKILVKDR